MLLTWIVNIITTLTMQVCEYRYCTFMIVNLCTHQDCEYSRPHNVNWVVTHKNSFSWYRYKQFYLHDLKGEFVQPNEPPTSYGPVIVPSTLIHNSVILCRDCIHQKLASFMLSVEKGTQQGGWGWAVVQMANYPGSSSPTNSRNGCFHLFGKNRMNTPPKPHSILEKLSADIQNSFLCLAWGGSVG